MQLKRLLLFGLRMSFLTFSLGCWAEESQPSDTPAPAEIEISPIKLPDLKVDMSRFFYDLYMLDPYAYILKVECLRENLTPSAEQPVEPPPETCAIEPYPFSRRFIPQWIYLTHGEETDEGIGNVKTYTTFGVLFAGDYRPGCFTPMLDLRIHNINGSCACSTYGASVGIVERYIQCCGDRIWGASVYYDYRQGAFFHWNQLSVGLESLGPCVSFRSNFYFPLEGKRIKKHLFDDFEGGFFALRRKIEYAFAGFDAEIEFNAVQCGDFFLYAAAGPYYLQGGCEKSWGAEVRLTPQYRDIFSVDFRGSYDSIFKAVGEIQITLSIPLYRLRCRENRQSCCYYDCAIFEPVRREDIILLKKRCCWNSNF